MKKRNYEKLLAYKGVGMSLPPLGISQSLKKLTNLPKRSKLGFFSLFFASVYFTLRALMIFNALSFLSLCYSRLKKGSLTSTSRLARVSEFSLSAKLALSLEGDKQLAE